VLAVAGRRVDAEGAETPRFARGDVAVVTRRIRDMLKELAPREVIASAAAGVDLIALDQAAALSIPTRVLLPFDRDRFRASSVADRGDSWTALYDDVLSGPAQIEIIDAAGAGDDAAYAAVTRGIVDRARRADRGAIALGVWDLVSRGEGDQSELFVRYARERGLRVVEITTRSEDDLPWDRTVFVAMPFGTKTVETKTESTTIDFDHVYKNVLKPAIQSTGTPDGLPFVPSRADEGFYSGIIDDIMYRRLELSRMCLADVTFQNANVMFELGIRYKARPSATVVVRQDLKALPFDIKSVRVTLFDPADEEAAREIVARLVDESARAEVVDSPVRAAIAATTPATVKDAVVLRGGKAAAEHGSDAMVSTLMHEAEVALAQGNESIALDRYEKVLQRCEDPEVRVRAAALAVRLERFADAVQHADAAIERDPSNGAAYRERGIAQERVEAGSGIASLRQAVALCPNDFDAWSSLGGALRRADDAAGALSAYQHAVDISNGDPYPLLNMLKLKTAAGMPASARDEVMLRAAARIRRAQTEAQPPQDTPWSFFDLSEIELYLGNDAQARQALLDGAGFARPAQLKSHRDAIAGIAAAAADPRWTANVAFLDELIATAPKPKPLP
jgi:tetratricopeptide (TPR) repeat protein